MSSEAKWFDIFEKVSIRVTLTGEPYRLEFYDYGTVEDIPQDGDKKRMEEGEEISSHLDESEDFLGKSRHLGMKKKLTNSILNFDKDEAENIVENFCRVADGNLEPMLEELEKTEEDIEERMKEVDMEEEDIEEKAIDWLNSPELLSNIDRVIHHHLAGETKNSLLVFLMILSSKTQKPGSLRPIGKASVGKSYIVENVAKLFPENMIVMRTAFSKMAPWNKAKPTDIENVRDWNLRNKCIIIKEEENSEEFLKQFRDVLARNDPINIYEVTNTESQKRETLYVRMVGWPAYIGLRVDPMTEEQESSRAMSMTPNAGKEKYSKSIWFQGYKDQSIWMDKMRKRETEVMRKAIDILNRYKVIIPHIDEIQKHFPSNRSEHQRHYQYFLALIRAMTLLHQKQRPVVETDEGECLVASPDDVEAVLRIAEQALSETISGLDARAQRFWRRLKSIDSVEGYSRLQDMYQNLFEERLSKTTIKRKFVEPLEEMNLLSINEGRGRNPHVFTAKGELSTLSSNFEKIKEACSIDKIKDSWFDKLCRNREYLNEVVLKNSPVHINNPVKDPSLDEFRDVWKHLCNKVNLLQHNEGVLSRDYEEDYGYKGPNREMQDKQDKESESEELPEGLELSGEDEETGSEDGREGDPSESKDDNKGFISQEQLASEIMEANEFKDFSDRDALVEEVIRNIDVDERRVGNLVDNMLQEGRIVI